MPRVKGEELLFKTLWRQYLVIFFNSVMNPWRTKQFRPLHFSKQNVCREAILRALE